MLKTNIPQNRRRIQQNALQQLPTKYIKTKRSVVLIFWV